MDATSVLSIARALGKDWNVETGQKTEQNPLMTEAIYTAPPPRCAVARWLRPTCKGGPAVKSRCPFKIKDALPTKIKEA